MNAQLIDKIKDITKENFPGLITDDYFKPGLTPDEIESLELEYGFELPQDVKTYLSNFGGEGVIDENGFQCGIFLGLSALDLEGIKRELDVWKQVMEENPEFEDIEYTSFPEGAVQTKYATNYWLGLAVDGSGNSIGVDLAPGPKGHKGQVITWGRDLYDYRIVAFSSWEEFLKKVVKDLEDKDAYGIDEEYNVYDLKDRFNYLDEIYSDKLKDYGVDC